MPRNHVDVETTLTRTETLFEAELAGKQLHQLVSATAATSDGYQLDWLLAPTGQNFSDRRMSIVIPIWRAHNAESLASLLTFLSYIHANKDEVSVDDLTEFVENVEQAIRTLVSSLAHS